MPRAFSCEMSVSLLLLSLSFGPLRAFEASLSLLCMYVIVAVVCAFLKAKDVGWVMKGVVR